MKEIKHKEGEREKYIFVEKHGVMAEAEDLVSGLGPPTDSFFYFDAVILSQVCHPCAKQSLSVGHLV